MLGDVYEGLNARPKVYLSKEYFCEMYPTCVSSKLCEFIFSEIFRKFFGKNLLNFGGVKTLAWMVWSTFFGDEVPQSARLSAGGGFPYVGLV